MEMYLSQFRMMGIRGESTARLSYLMGVTASRGDGEKNKITDSCVNLFNKSFDTSEEPS